MRNDERIAEFVRDQNIVPFTRPPPFSRPAPTSFAGPTDHDNARTKLLHTRQSDQNWKDPQKGFRAKIGIRNQKTIDRMNEVFTLNERRDAFDDVLRNREPVGLAQAIIDFHPREPFDINIRKEEIPKGSKKGDITFKAQITSSRWLQTATTQGRRDFVNLLASRNPSQKSLDESLKTAITQNSQVIVEELVRHGANPNTCPDEFLNLVKHGNTAMTGLLMNCNTHTLDQKIRDTALVTAVKNQSFNMVNQLLVFGADANSASGQAFSSAAQLSDLRLLTLLIWVSTNVDSWALQNAINLVIMEINKIPRTRDDILDMLDLLLWAGATIQSPDLLDLLCSSVSVHDLSTVSLLANHGQISPEHASIALSQLPQNLTEDEALEMSRLLFNAQAQGQILGPQLLWAVQKEFYEIITLLVEHGVSLDFEDARAVRLALERQDTKLLDLLLNGNSVSSETSTCTSTVLANALSDALIINNKDRRHEAVRLLLRKGVSGYGLDKALLDVVTKPDICNLNLAKDLLERGADVNFVNQNKNCILTAAKDGNLKILNQLSRPRPNCTPLPQILTDAVSLVFESRGRWPSSEVVKSMTCLFESGAEGSSVVIAGTLVKAIHAAVHNENMTIVRLLLDSGADVNFNQGQPIQQALQLDDTEALVAICKTGRISPDTFATVLPLAIDISRNNQSKARILLNSCQAYRDIISDFLIKEVGLGDSGGQDEIVSLLLSSNASVNYRNGTVFSKVMAIQSAPKLSSRLELFLSKNPDQEALGCAFDSVRKLLCPLTHRYNYFKSILDAGYRGSGIHIALIEAIAADYDDANIPRLLLHYGASVDYENGKPLALAATSGNISLLDLLMAYGPNKASLEQAFKYCCDAEMPSHLISVIFKCLLASHKISIGYITYALSHTITHGSTDPTLLNLLTSHGALLEGKALSSLITREDDTTAKLLLKSQTPGIQIRSQAFRSCFDLEKSKRLAFANLLITAGIEPAVWKAALHRSIKDRDHKLLILLLHNRTLQNSEIEESLVLAADTADPKTMEILLTCEPNSSNRDQAFGSMLDSKMMQHSVETMQTALLLLDRGISQHLRDRALIHSLQSFPENKSDFYRELIEHGANVNTHSCICFCLAGQFDKLDVFRTLLASNPNFDLLVQILVRDFSEKMYDRLITLLCLVLDSEYERSDPPKVEIIFEAIRRFPRGERLIRLLLDHQYPPGNTTVRRGSYSVNAEAVTPVIWALEQSKPRVSDNVILELLKEGKEG